MEHISRKESLMRMRKNSKNKKTYYGNIVHRNGDIYNAVGKKLNVLKNGSVQIYIDGKKRTWKAAKIVYEAFTEKKVKKSDIIIYKDGNVKNADFDNIQIVERKDYFKKYNYDAFFSLSNEEVEAAVKMKKEGKITKDGKRAEYSCREIANKFHVSKSTMYKVLNGTYKQKGVVNADAEKQ